MTTSFAKDLTGAELREKVRNFYDLGSPLYFEVYGRHIHDGYYINGKESKEEAQENLTRLLAEKARIQRGARVLDVGCGVGGSSIWLAENLGATTVGITLSPEQLKIAQQLALERKASSSFLLMDAENMHFEERFDAIWVLAAMTHFRNQAEFIKRAGRFLNPGGKFIIFDWMPEEHAADVMKDRYIKPVAERMLLASLHPLNSYLKWFMQDGYRIIYAEDVTDHTLKTWDDALAVIKKPSVLKLAARIRKEQVAEILSFLKSISAMKLAMRKNKMKAAIAIAEKL